MIHDTMALFDAIHSQRAIRHFSAQPVSDEAIETMLHAAICAPSGGNRQPWRFVVIRDAALKRRLGQWYLAAWQAATADMETLPPTVPPRRGTRAADGYRPRAHPRVHRPRRSRSRTGADHAGRLHLSRRPESAAGRPRSRAR